MPNALFIGISTVDTVHVVNQFPKPNTKNYPIVTYTAPGGGATNAARACVRENWKNQNTQEPLINVDLVTRFDPHSDDNSNFSRTLDLESVHVHNLGQKNSHDLIRATILVESTTGDRTIIASGDEAMVKVSSPLSDDTYILNQLCDNACIVGVDGYETNIALHAARRVAPHGVPVVASFGRYRPDLDELISLATIVIVSQDFQPDEGAIAYLNKLDASLCVITHGGDPIEFFTPTGGEGEPEIHRVPVPVDDRPVVDTLGAGDVFHGAFVYGCVKFLGQGDYSRPLPHKQVVDCVKFAVEQASESVRSYGGCFQPKL